MTTNDRSPVSSTPHVENRQEDEKRVEEQLADAPLKDAEGALRKSGVQGLRADALIRVDAPVEAVWKALTDPAWVEQYFFGTRLRTEWKVGEPIVFSGTWEGRSYEDNGTVLSYEAPHRLSYTYQGAQDERVSTITYVVEMDGSGTRVTITQDGCSSVDHCDRCAQHWQQVLQGLKKVVEPA